MTLQVKLNSVYSYSLCRESRVTVGPFNVKNDKNPLTHKIGFRIHNKIVGWFLELIAKATKLKLQNGRVIYANTASIHKWLIRHKVQPSSCLENDINNLCQNYITKKKIFTKVKVVGRLQVLHKQIQKKVALQVNHHYPGMVVKDVNDLINQTKPLLSETLDEIHKNGSLPNWHDYPAALQASDKTKYDQLLNEGAFYNGTMPKAFFTRQDSITETNVLQHFIINKGVLPSKAMDAAIKGPNLVSYGIATQIYYFQIIRKILGDVIFDKLFAANSSAPLQFISFGPGYQFNILSYFLTVRKLRDKHYLDMSTEEKINFTKGTCLMVGGEVSYQTNHPLGEYLFVTCTDPNPKNPKFAVVGEPKNGHSRDKIVEKWLDLYKRPANVLPLLSPVVMSTFFSKDKIKELKARHGVPIQYKDHMKNAQDYMTYASISSTVSVFAKRFELDYQRLLAVIQNPNQEIMNIHNWQSTLSGKG